MADENNNKSAEEIELMKKGVLTHQYPPDFAGKYKLQNLTLALFKLIDGPVTYWKENVVQPIQTRRGNKFYHRKYNRVPTIDQCAVDDNVCIYEADVQLDRDRRVDYQITMILDQRLTECMAWEGYDKDHACKHIRDKWQQAMDNFYIKYGDIRLGQGSKDVYMKQKHRLIWERRHPHINLYGNNPE